MVRLLAIGGVKREA